ncbi:MAG TPA: hypothetical protein VF843_01955 [Streptosporangiaceae bacterium]
MRAFRTLRFAVSTAAAGAVAAGAAAAVPAVAAPRAGSSWHVSFRVQGSGFPSFTAAAATSSTGAWAFDQQGSKAPAGYQFSGSHWTKRSFPAAAGDVVNAASASSAGNVWAFTFKGAVLRYNGSAWSQVKKFTRPVDSGLAISPSDVWAFGANLGTWHYDGHAWTRVTAAKGLESASALSASSVWAVGGTKVGHWNGHAWSFTSLASLLPKNTQLSHSRLAGVYAASANSIWVAGTGGRQDEGGPFVLLHYNGHAWSRAGENKSIGDPTGIAGDGHGGVWISIRTGFPGDGTMEHYAGGKLSSVTLPVTPAHLFLFGVTNAKGSTAPLAFGYSRTSFNAKTFTAVILRDGS